MSHSCSKRKLISFYFIAVLLISNLTILSSFSSAVECADDHIIPYIYRDAPDAPEYQYPDFGIWAEENTIFQHTWIAGDETTGGLQLSIEILPAKFDYNGGSHALFDYVVHIRTVADISYRVWSPLYGNLPVGIRSVDLKMTYDSISSSDSYKESKVYGVSGDKLDDPQNTSLYSARYYYPCESGINNWWLDYREPATGVGYTTDFNTFQAEYFLQHAYAEEVKAALLQAMWEGAVGMFTTALPTPWPEMIGFPVGYATNFMVPEVEPSLDVDAGLEEGVYDREWSILGTPHLPYPVTDGQNDDTGTEDWIQSVRDTFYYVGSKIPCNEIESGFTLTGGVQFAPIFNDINIDLWDLAGTVDIHVKPDMFTKWNVPPRANPKQPVALNGLSTTQADVGQLVQFNIEGLGYDYEGDTILYGWDFDDGTKSSLSSNAYTTHSYTSAGTYHPSLLVDDMSHEYIKSIDRYENPIGEPWSARETLCIIITQASLPTIDVKQSSYGWYNTVPSPLGVYIDIDFYSTSFSYLSKATYQLLYGSGDYSDVTTIFESINDNDYTTGWYIPWAVIPEGLHYLLLDVWTSAGAHQTSNNIIIRRDTVCPPVPTLNNPISGSIEGTIVPSFQWICVDSESGINKYELLIDTSPNFNSGPNGGPLYRYEPTVSYFSKVLDDSTTYFWKVRGIDFAGNIGPWSIISGFSVQNPTPPFTIAINNGATYSKTSATSITINPDASISPIQMRFMNDAGAWSEKSTSNIVVASPHDVPANYDDTKILRDPGATYIMIGFSDMDLKVNDYVYLYDKDGNCIQTFTNVRFGKSIDGTPGRFSNQILGDTARIRIVTNSVDPSWGYVITQYKAYTNWGSWQLYVSPAPWTLQSEGQNKVLCQLRENLATISGTNFDSIILDSQSPSLALSISESTDLIIVENNKLYYTSSGNSAFSVKVSASDGLSGVWKVAGSSLFGDSPVTSTLVNGQYILVYSIESGSVYDGPLYATAYDFAGNTNSASITVVHDNQAPVTALSFPPNNYWISDTTPTFLWSSSDSGAGVNKCRIQISKDSSFTQIVCDVYVNGNSYTSPLLDQNIPLYWRVQAMDNLMQWSTFTSANLFYIDAVNPIASISYPIGISVGGTCPIIGQASDSHIKSYSLQYGGGNSPSVWYTFASGANSVTGTLGSWDTSRIPNGIYSIRLIVSDLAENVASASTTIEVFNAPAIYDLQTCSVSPKEIRFSFFLNSYQTINSYVTDESDNLVRTLFQGAVMAGRAYTSVMPWDWKDDSGNEVPAGNYHVVVSSLESATDAILDYTLYPAPVISLIAGAGSLNPTFSWNNPIGATGTKYILSTVDMPLYETFGTSATIPFSKPGTNKFSLYARNSLNSISKVAVYSYTVPSATIYGTVTAPFWGPGMSVTISASLDEKPNLIGWQAIGSGCTSTTTGTYSMEVAAGALLIMASENINGYMLANPYFTFITASPGQSYQVNFELVAQPSSGGTTCPYLWVWDGNEYVIDNNVLGQSEFMDSDFNIITDYYLLENKPVLNEGVYSLAVDESETEYDIFDSFELLYVDHPSEYNVGIDNNGIIRTYSDPIPPITCIDGRGMDHLNDIMTCDEPYYNAYDGDTLEMNFGLISSETAKLIVRTDEKPGSGIDDPTIYDVGPIVVEVFDQWGQSIKVVELCPRAMWSTDIVDLSDYIIPGTELVVKLSWMAHHKITYVGLDTNEDYPVTVSTPSLIDCDHSEIGDVTEMVDSLNNVYLEMVPQEYIILDYEYIAQTEEVRDFILISTGYYCTDGIRPTAQFIVTSQETTTYDSIYFDASSSYNNFGTISGYLYAFGDGTDSGWLDHPITSHMYLEKGNYNATLFVKDSSEPPIIDIETMNINILNSPPVSIPEAYQEVEITLMTAGRKGNYVTLEIIEDGMLIDSITVSRNPYDPKDQVNSTLLHRYVGRTYEYRLVYDATHLGENPVWVTFESGESLSTYETLFCTDYGLSQENVINLCYIDPILASNPTYYFDASVSYDLDGTIISYEWNFGDGGISTDISLSHTFVGTGIFEVVLTTIDNEGYVSQKSITIEIS